MPYDTHEDDQYLNKRQRKTERKHEVFETETLTLLMRIQNGKAAKETDHLLKKLKYTLRGWSTH